MADNVDLAALTGLAAADEVTYSGDTSKVQLVRNVQVTGAEGSKTVVENMPASLGQKAMAASFPVVLPSDQTVAIDGTVNISGGVSIADTVIIADDGGSITVDAPVATPVFVRLSDGAAAITTLPVSAASLPLPAGAATETTLAAASAKLPATLGQKTKANSLPVTLASDSDALVISGAVTASGTLAVTQSGTWDEVGINDSGNSITVDGTFWQATQPVSGTVAVTGVATETSIAAAATSLAALDDLVIAEDAIHTTGDKGIVALAVRRDTATSSTATDGDYGTLTTDTAGRLRTSSADTTQPVSGTFWQATQPVSGTVTANAGSGTQAVSLATAPALVASSANIGDVDVLTIAAGDNNIGNVDVVTLPALVAGSANIGDVDVLTVPAPLSTTGSGTQATALRTTSASDDPAVVALQILDNIVSGSEAQVDVVTLPNVTIGTMAALVAGSAAIGKLAANTGVDIGDVDVTSVIPGTGATNLGKAVDSAGAGTDTGIAMLGLREDALVTITPADGDYARFKMDSLGKQWVNTGISPELHVSKSFNATTTQTGIDVWDPGAGKKIAVVSVVIGTYGTTAARVILWFGDNADTTYTAGTDQVLLAASFAPSATAKPGLVYTPSMPVICNTADRELHVTTDAGISLDITVSGFEF